jgi:hypothetical protein
VGEAAAAYSMPQDAWPNQSERALRSDGEPRQRGGCPELTAHDGIGAFSAPRSRVTQALTQPMSRWSMLDESRSI